MPTPLQPYDPPQIGDFWLDARLTAGPSGVVFIGHDNDDTPVMLTVLSDGAATDAAARDRLAGEVNKMHIDTVVARGGQGQDEGRLAGKFRSEEDDPVSATDAPIAPWVALAYDGSPNAVAEANRLLTAVDLSRTPLLGSVAGPDYSLHWRENTRPGNGRLWPLPWPGRYDRAGWITIAVSWLLMVLMAALALLIAVLIFSKQPPASPPPQVTPSPQSGSPSPQSGSPSPQSGSPSPSGSQSSPSPSGSQSSASPSNSPGTDSPPSDSPSMSTPDPSGTKSAGSPTPNKKL